MLSQNIIDMGAENRRNEKVFLFLLRPSSVSTTSAKKSNFPHMRIFSKSPSR